nr:hypothetical protein [Tanacetum cinerariifolium]
MLSKLAAIQCDSLMNGVLVEELNERSMDVAKVNMVVEEEGRTCERIPKKDKIELKLDKNRKCGKARKSQKQLQSVEEEKLKKTQKEGQKMQSIRRVVPRNYNPKGERFLIASRFPTLPLACAFVSLRATETLRHSEELNVLGSRGSSVLDSSVRLRIWNVLERGYHYHPLHVASYPFDQIQPDMSLSEEHESILDSQERVIRNKTIPFVKIL